MSEKEALISMFERGGGLYSEDLSIQVLAGNCWGGGTTINWYLTL
jgi:hypothetical protein